jgi:aryl-alcohol dehydrogenase-like predicted oxidoreductase
MTRPGAANLQCETIRHAIDSGINWFDTAATYGDGTSEEGLGRALAELGARDRVHVATKVRVPESRLGDIAGFVRESLRSSLGRLGISRVTLLQVHNSVTAQRGDLFTSITPADVLGPGGVLEGFASLRREGVVDHFGLTGLGDLPSLREVITSRAFAAIQMPFNLLNPTAGSPVAPVDGDFDFANLIGHCADYGVGVLAIRVFAGGALTGQPPSAHTRRTKFFPLELYERDRRRAAEMAQRLPGGTMLSELAVRFVLSHPAVTSALIGFSEPGQVDEALRSAARGPLAAEEIAMLDRLNPRN